MITLKKSRIWRIHPSAFLLAAQLLLLVLYSVFDGMEGERAWLSLFGLVVLVLRVWVVNRSPGFDWIAWLLAVPAFVFEVLFLFSPNTTILVWTSLLEAALYFYAAASLIAYMMKDIYVTTDELFAAGATYTLLGWGFAYVCLLTQTLSPGSFAGTGGPNQVFSFVELLFVSFTNLSATGLSDIVPASTTARVILIIEQFSGVGYIAVVISRLVGLTLQRQGEK